MAQGRSRSQDQLSKRSIDFTFGTVLSSARVVAKIQSAATLLMQSKIPLVVAFRSVGRIFVLPNGQLSNWYRAFCGGIILLPIQLLDCLRVSELSTFHVKRSLSWVWVSSNLESVNRNDVPEKGLGSTPVLFLIWFSRK